MSSGEDNKAAVRAFFPVAEDGNLDALDAIVSPDYVLHDPGSPEEIRGVEGARDLVTMYRNAMGGLRVTIEHQFSDGDYVATRFTAHGTHDGEFMGVPPTGRDVTVACITISRCRDGKVVEEWELSDTLGALQQIGALPEMAQS
jgi:steroid delta-isomerase-like uncharacterized protein